MLDTLLFLAAAPEALNPEASGGISALANQFGIDWRLILAQAINFIVVAFLLFKFAFKPVLKTIDQRQQKIADGLQYAQEMKEKLAEAERKQQEMLRKAQQDAQQIVTEARTSAKEFYDRQTQETAQKVEEMLERGKQANELERQRILSEVRQEVARLVVQTSARVLAKELSEQEKSAFNQRASEELASVR